MHRARETQAQSFPVIKMFNEVSNLLGTSLDIRRSEENNREYRASRVFSSILLMYSGDPSKRLTLMNTFTTGKDRARDSRVIPGLGACLCTRSPTPLSKKLLCISYIIFFLEVPPSPFRMQLVVTQ
jgi:hypothetical protein